eukprot:TRINITY_DN898_c0_g2_i1.p1 TRINITY_DN898_c0_g2~~TRINITY_DN898_c0_g2_i1.p1  ORF type:complete len:562 (-),score=77.88 TRINITY_DN898_c0_g2_i1:19-1704(-)
MDSIETDATDLDTLLSSTFDQLINLVFNNTGWKYNFDKNYVIGSKMQNEHFYYVMGQGLVEVSPLLVYSILNDPDRFVKLNGMIKKVSLVKTLKDGVSLLHFSIPGLFPWSPRDLSVVMSSREYSDGSYVVAFRSLEHPLIPPVQGVTRAHLGPSGFVIRPSRYFPRFWGTELSYILQIDPKGRFPWSVAQLLYSHQPMRIARVRSMCDSRINAANPESLRTMTNDSNRAEIFSESFITHAQLFIDNQKKVLNDYLAQDNNNNNNNNNELIHYVRLPLGDPVQDLGNLDEVKKKIYLSDSLNVFPSPEKKEKLKKKIVSNNNILREAEEDTTSLSMPQIEEMIRNMVKSKLINERTLRDCINLFHKEMTILDSEVTANQSNISKLEKQVKTYYFKKRMYESRFDDTMKNYDNSNTRTIAPHKNGYQLDRRILERREVDWTKMIEMLDKYQEQVQYMVIQSQRAEEEIQKRNIFWENKIYVLKKRLALAEKILEKKCISLKKNEGFTSIKKFMTIFLLFFVWPMIVYSGFIEILYVLLFKKGVNFVYKFLYKIVDQLIIKFL